MSEVQVPILGQTKRAKRTWAYIVKANGKWQCQECGSAEMLQAHSATGKHNNPEEGVCLCADCHSEKHPNVPKALFFSKRLQPYWQNISASSLAKEIGVCPRTIIRRAKKLGISTGELSSDDKSKLCEGRLEGIDYSELERYSMLTIDDVRKELKVSQSTVYLLIKTNKLKALRVGHAWRIREEDFEQFRRELK